MAGRANVYAYVHVRVHVAVHARMLALAPAPAQPYPRVVALGRVTAMTHGHLIMNGVEVQVACDAQCAEAVRW